jgi:peptidoglycan/xylan/chitin deacetylase (PgdA/CDA1 family)
MTIKWLRRLEAEGRRLRRLAWPPALILLYHRIAKPAYDPFRLAVSPEHFEEQLGVIRDHTRPLPLSELTESARRGRVPPRAVALTFDDGYADNYSTALPSLGRHAVPATVFIAAGQIGSDREFWWDELERLLLQADEIPPLTDLRIGGLPVGGLTPEEWRADDTDPRCHRDWRVEVEPPGSRQRLFRALYPVIQPLPHELQADAMSSVRRWLGEDLRLRPEYRALSVEELVRLANGPGIDIGAHTMNHVMLSALPISRQRDEIAEGRMRLEQILGRRPASVSYPYGRFNDETKELVSSMGFSDGFSTVAEAVPLCPDRFAMPRICVEDWDGATFLRRLQSWWR